MPRVPRPIDNDKAVSEIKRQVGEISTDTIFPLISAHKHHADAPPKKLSMMAAALHVLQQRKVAMTCPELIDVMTTEDL